MTLSQPSTIDIPSARRALLQVDRPVYLLHTGSQWSISDQPAPGAEVIAVAPAVNPEKLGDPAFNAAHHTRYAYMGGSMANGISSEKMVLELGRFGALASFGSAGVAPSRLEETIASIQAALPNGPCAFNLIHSPGEEALERRAVDLYLARGVDTVEASAFIGLTSHIVRYRAAGLARNPDGTVMIRNRVIAKLSRAEVAQKFMQPAPEKLLNELVAAGLITSEQASLAGEVPLADDVTVEADSGGHTDNRPLVCLLPAMLALRDEVQEKYAYAIPVRVGAAGGISTPESALAAFMMGAAYVVTGSINQACVEAGACEHTRRLLAKASMTDVMMAPSADMFELGVKVQVLKAGTLFPLRAHKLYEIYSRYESIEQIPAEDRAKLETQVFRQSLETVWKETVQFFEQRDPDQIQRAQDNPRRKMALIFRWYLGLSSRWSGSGEPGREMDYQVWCGPSIGPFNAWTRGTYLEDFSLRRVADVAAHLLHGAAYLYRIQSLRLQGAALPSALCAYRPESPLA